MNRLKSLLVVSLALVVAACANHVNSDVSRFNEMPAVNGQSVQIVALKAENMGGIEFGQYKALIETSLTEQGFVVSDDNPDMVATVDFARSEGERKWVYAGGPFKRGRFVVHGRFFWGYSPFYDPFDPFYDDRDMVRRTVYTHNLTITIDDADGKRVFEGKVMSENRYGSLPKVMPYLVEAMFVDFPGKSGETKHIVIKMDGDKNSE